MCKACQVFVVMWMLSCSHVVYVVKGPVFDDPKLSAVVITVFTLVKLSFVFILWLKLVQNSDVIVCMI